MERLVNSLKEVILEEGGFMIPGGLGLVRERNDGFVASSKAGAGGEVQEVTTPEI